jgi:competence protein ComEC
MLWWPLMHSPLVSPRAAEGLSLHFLDVGQGDAALLRTPGGRWIAIDAGPADEGWDAGERVVLPFLARHRVDRLTLLVISHAHRDHVGGAAGLATRVPIGAVLEPAEPFDDRQYLALLDVLGSQRIPWTVAVRGTRWQVDGVSFEILHPPRAWPGRGLDLNEDSVVLLIRYGDFSALFTGDAGFSAELAWQADVGPVDLLKVGHHGSAGSTGADLLAAVQPQAAIISSGRNRYGHPARITLQRLAAVGVSTWRTDREGTVSVDTDGHTFRVRGGRTDARFDARDPLPEMPTCCTPPR